MLSFHLFPQTETMNSHTFRELPFTSSNAFATATSLAQLYGALAEGGTVRSKKTKLMSPKTVKQLYTPLVSGIEDTMGFNMTIAHGTFMRENPMVRHLIFTLPMLRLLLSKAQDTKIFENHLNPVMLVLIGQLSLSTLRRIPMCQGFSIHFWVFCIIMYWPS